MTSFGGLNLLENFSNLSIHIAYEIFELLQKMDIKVFRILWEIKKKQVDFGAFMVILGIFQENYDIITVKNLTIF